MFVGNRSYTQNHRIENNTSNSPAEKSSASEMARKIYQVKQSEYGFRRGHQRSNATDFRIETKINLKSVGNPVSRSTTELVDKLGSGARIKP